MVYYRSMLLYTLGSILYRSHASYATQLLDPQFDSFLNISITYSVICNSVIAK